MIITQTPFRMSFFGGGTDFPGFYKEHGGAVISTTFDKYCYVNVRHLPRFFDYSTELSYSRIERVTDVEEYDERNEFTDDVYVSAYYHLVGGPEPPKHPMYGSRKWAWHEKYSWYPDSMTELVEFLKAVQKGGE